MAAFDIAFNPPQFFEEYDGVKMRQLVEELERLHSVLTADTDDEGVTGTVDSFNGRVGDITPIQADYDAFFLTPAEGDALFLTPAEGDAAYAAIGNVVNSFEGRQGNVAATVGDYADVLETFSVLQTFAAGITVSAGAEFNIFDSTDTEDFGITQSLTETLLESTFTAGGSTDNQMNFNVVSTGTAARGYEWQENGTQILELDFRFDLLQLYAGHGFRQYNSGNSQYWQQAISGNDVNFSQLSITDVNFPAVGGQYNFGDTVDVTGNITVSGTVDGRDVASDGSTQDSHIADGTIHFTEGSIDHTAIQNIGSNSHAAIDSHIADATLHFTEGSIDHGSIAGLGDDDHPQYTDYSHNETITGNWAFEMDTIGDFFFRRNGTTGAAGIGFSNDDGVKGYVGYGDDEGFRLWDSSATTLFTVAATGEVISTDIFTAASGGDSDDWDTAFGWGDHAGLYAAASHTHAASDVTSGTFDEDLIRRIDVTDTRAVDDAPDDFDNAVQFDFKQRSVLGYPGNDTYGGVMTVAPWGDASGGPNYQLAFSNNTNVPLLAIRAGDHGATAGDWGTWYQIHSEVDFSVADVASGVTAFGWGDHASGGYAPLASPNFTGQADFSNTGSQIRIIDTDDGDGDYSLIERNGTSYNVYYRDTVGATWYNWMRMADTGAVTFPDITSLAFPIEITTAAGSSTNWNTAYSRINTTGEYSAAYRRNIAQYDRFGSNQDMAGTSDWDEGFYGGYQTMTNGPSGMTYDPFLVMGSASDVRSFLVVPRTASRALAYKGSYSTGVTHTAWHYAGWTTTVGDADLSIYAKSGSIVAADIDAEASTDGYVLTSDGAGNAAWEAVTGGSGLPTTGGTMTGSIALDEGEVLGALITSGVGSLWRGGYPFIGRTYSAAATAIGNNAYIDPADAVSNQYRTAITHASYGHTIYQMAGGEHIWYGNNNSVTANAVVTKQQQMILNGAGVLGVTTSVTAPALVGSTSVTTPLVIGAASSSRDKLRVYSSSSYAIGFQTGFTFGGLGTDYAMTFQMNDSATRGFWWGDINHTNAQGAMALTTDGKLTVAHSTRVGYGETDTTTPGSTYRLDVNGITASLGLQARSGNSVVAYDSGNGDYIGLIHDGSKSRIFNLGSATMDMELTSIVEAQLQDSDTSGYTSGLKIKDHGQTLQDAGFNVLPTFNFNASDTLEAQHCGHSTGKTNTTSYTLTGPTSSDVDFPVGGVCTIMNLGSSTVYNLADTSTCTMYVIDGNAGTITDIVGAATIAVGGIVTLYRYSTAAIYLWGSGLTA